MGVEPMTCRLRIGLTPQQLRLASSVRLALGLQRSSLWSWSHHWSRLAMPSRRHRAMHRSKMSEKQIEHANLTSQFREDAPVSRYAAFDNISSWVLIHRRGVQHGLRPGNRLGNITATTAAPKKEIPMSRAMRMPLRKSFSAKMTPQRYEGWVRCSLRNLRRIKLKLRFF